MIVDTTEETLIKDEQMRLDRFNERELTRLQVKYRNYANCKYAIKEYDKNKFKNMLKNLNQIKCERRDLKSNLFVATGTVHLKEYDQHMDSLATQVNCQESINERIDIIKTYINHLMVQLKRLDAERLRVNKTGLSNLQHKSYLQKAYTNRDILENRLNVSRQQECQLILINSKFRSYIDHMLYVRALFNKLWQRMTTQLSYDKKFLIDMVDRAVLAYNQGAVLCNKLDTLREKSIRERKMHIVELLDMIRQLDADEKMNEFLKVKGNTRKLIDIEDREYKRRHKFREEHIQKTKFYQKVINKVIECSGYENITQAMEKFDNCDNEYFANFNYLNNLNRQIEFLTDCLNKIYLNIDTIKLNNTDKEENQKNTVQILDGQLEIKTKETIRINDLYKQSDQRLNIYLNGVNKLFTMLGCNVIPLNALLGDHSKVTKQNVNKYLSLVEEQLITVLKYVYYAERKTPENQQNKFIVDGVSQENNDPMPVQDILLAEQCAECAEGEDVNRYDEEIVYPLEMNDVRTKVRAKTEAPEMQFRLHNLSKCRLPRSRALVNKRYQ